MTLLYNIGIFLYGFTIRCFAFFNPKAKAWITGRKNIFEQLTSRINPSTPTLWMHCASLGEFEQGRPVLEYLKNNYPKHQIVLSFFSPSGYQIRKDYPLADVVCYLPLDTKSNALRWIELVQPQLALFVKYEFWYHYLNQLQTAGIPSLLLSATFRPSQIFFRPYGAFFRKMLTTFQHIFVQTPQDLELLQTIAIDQVSISGDTRIDRVRSIAAKPKKIPQIEQFIQDKKVLILGSSWPQEERLLSALLTKHPDFATEWKIIIAPHDVASDHIRAIEHSLPIASQRFSQSSSQLGEACSVLIIDNIGMLSSLYQYGRIAFIGGGFGVGIHNTLEPIAFGLPVLFGPNYQKFTEAKALIATGGAFCIQNEQALYERLQKLDDPATYDKATEQTKLYLKKHQGATQRISKFIDSMLTSL